MLDINFIKANPEQVKIGIKNKGFDPGVVDRLLAVNQKRVELVAQVNQLRSKRNKLTKDEIEKGKEIKDQLKELEPQLKALEIEFEDLQRQIPNLPAADVPIGTDETGNQVLRSWGEKTQFSFIPKSHFELGENLGIIDVDRAAKVSGSRFGYLKNEGALLELALINFAFETLTQEGFIPVIPPVMIRTESMAGLGYMEYGGEEDMYVLEKDQLVLVGTSEQSIVPMHRGEILEASKLPLRYLGFSSCFRREAGSYGKDTKGILRVHQFDKVEMVSFTMPDKSDEEHEFLLALEEKLFQALGIPYRVVKMCSGDLGFPVYRKYDLEAWIPSEEKYREVTSVSIVTDFQARRLNIKYKNLVDNNKISAHLNTNFVHILNGTAFAIGRTIIAILENFQQQDGSITIPQVLQKYTGFSRIKPSK